VAQTLLAVIRRIKRTHLLSTLWALGVLTLTGLVVGFCAITASSLEREAVTRQQVRTDEIALRIEEKFLVIEQIVRTMAGLVAPMRSREQVERLLETVLESTPDHFVYGIGVWFKPYAFSPHDRYFGPYVHRGDAGRTRPVLTYEWTTPDYDFPHQPWFPRGLLARDAVAFIEPYFDTDHAYMSSLMAILDDRGEAVGVVSVDVILPQIARFIEDEASAANETIHVSTRRGALLVHPAAAAILSWARAHGPTPASLLDVRLDDLRAFQAEQRPGPEPLVTRAAVSKLGWTVAIAADRRALFSGARWVRWGALPAVALLWTGMLGLYLLRRRARRLESMERALEREELVQSILRESERRLRAILEAALHAVVGMDARGVIVDWNPQAEAMFGWPAREVLGRPASEVLLGERFQEGHERGLLDFQRSDQAQVLNRRLEISALRRDGSELPIELLVTRIQGSEGDLFYAFIADISERKRVEEERAGLLERIQQRSAELQAILDSMVDGVVACDAAQRVTLMNHAASRLFGLAPGVSFSLDDVVERYRISSTDGGLMKHDDLPLLRALSSGAVARGSLVSHVPGRVSEIHVQSSAAPIRDSRGRIVAAVAVVRDVTSAIELEHLKDQFLEITAHELKTPITIMKSYAQLALQDGEGLSPPLRRKLEGINRGADRIDQIVRDLLDVSQAYLGRLQLLLTPLDLRELLEETAARFGRDRSRHRVRVRAPLPALVRGDRRRLENVISTLLDNAVRYSPGGGDVEVTLTVERDEAIVAVEDHGIGIPTKGQSRIFERFYRAHSGTDQDYGGLGVGLYISKQMVELLGGRMWFQSEEGGSRFMFSLPLAAEERPGS
jgi:PAS domain S-box-containing protein